MERIDTIRLFNVYLQSAEKAVTTAARTLERKYILLFQAKELAITIYAQENKYVIYELLIANRSMLESLHTGVEFNNLFKSIEQFFKIQCHEQYIQPTGNSYYANK